MKYIYSGNKVASINEQRSNSTKRNRGFIDISTVARYECYYDRNRNMVRDLNKDIRTIRYNYLNLPVEVVWGDGRKQRFYYDYGGGLLRMERIKSGNILERRDYVGSFVFEGGSLSEVLTGEGRLLLKRYVKPDFFVRDHLGSVRAVVSATLPSDTDLPTFSQYETNIIVGRLGQSSITRRPDGTIQIGYTNLGIVIYRAGESPLDLTRNAVKRIIKHQNKK